MTRPVTQFRVSDKRVRAATGRGRDEWFALLDAAGAADLAHSERARVLTDRHDVDGWWSQTIVVDYEQDRGLRAPYEHDDGFSASKSKTLAVPIAAVYQACVDDATRTQWLGDSLDVTSTNEPKSVRGRWEDGPTRVAIRLTAKGDHKTTIQVQHDKLPDADAVDRVKREWDERLGRLAELLAAS